MKKAFTLVELIIVIIIASILSSIALGQYAKSVEKSREAEALNILGSLRRIQIAYYLANEEYGTLSDLESNIPGGCETQTTHFFQYACDTTGGWCTAMRCGYPYGKKPPIAAGKMYWITLKLSGELSRGLGANPS